MINICSRFLSERLSGVNSSFFVRLKKKLIISEQTSALFLGIKCIRNFSSLKKDDLKLVTFFKIYLKMERKVDIQEEEEEVLKVCDYSRYSGRNDLCFLFIRFAKNWKIERYEIIKKGGKKRLTL